MRHEARLFLCALGLLFVSSQTGARAEEVRIAQQYGLPYLPLSIMEKRGFLIERGRQQGLTLEPQWTHFTGGAPMNEALISGNLDFASGGIAPLLVIWNRTASSLHVKGVAALDMMPIALNTSNPAVKTVKDFSEKDRIAVPAARVSANAIVLEMAAAQAFGDDGWNRFESQMVSMANPDAQANLVHGTAGVTAHFAPEPYSSEELKQNPQIHRVISSIDVMGNAYGFYVWATSAYVEAHPKVMIAFLAALDDSEHFIVHHPLEAAKIWIETEHSTIPPSEVAAIISAPENIWTSRPNPVDGFARFMAKTGLLKDKLASDIFFDRPRLSVIDLQ